jgi:flagellar biosynthesis protein FlhB
MAEEQQSDLEKTEPASPRRLEQAREKGQVARSLELNTFSLLLVAGAVMILAGPLMIDGMTRIMREGLSLDRAAAVEPAVALARLHFAMLDALWVLAPFFGACFLIALCAPMLLSGWLFSPEALEAKFSRLNPLTNIMRTLSLHGLVELVKAVLKTVLLGGVVIWVLWSQAEALAVLATEPLHSGLAHVGELITDAFIAVMLAMLLIVLIDVPFQLFDHAKQLRMTKDEVKKEAKESEGNPEIKGRVRQLQREMSRKRMMSAVPNADVIITNPTHYAVALRYQEGRMRAPQVVAKGAREVAQRIIEIGRENQVPLLRAPPLARALHQHAELGEAVPATLYGAVAEVLAWVYQLRLARGLGAQAPGAPEALVVPPGLDPGPDPEDAAEDAPSDPSAEPTAPSRAAGGVYA